MKARLTEILATANLMRWALDPHLEGTDPGGSDFEFYLHEAEGNLGQFIEELEKALGTLK